MALSATCIFDVRNGGSDTANGGLFNPGATLNTNGAATSATGSAPVFTSATYNFVAGDVGHWLFIKSGTNWTPGWYQIASVAANAATLTAGAGTGYLYLNGAPYGVTTAAGCATTGSPTSATWSIDYSQNTAAPFSLTGLTTAAANAIILTASATVAMIGNGIVITGGTNFTTGIYQINSASAGVSLTVDRTCTSAAGAAGTAGLGGAYASPGFACSVAVQSSLILLAYNASVYSITSATTNIAAGCCAPGVNVQMIGYNATRSVTNADANMPTIQLNVTTATMFVGNASFFPSLIHRVICDGNSQTTSLLVGGNNAQVFSYCTIKGFSGAHGNLSGIYNYCKITANSTGISGNTFYGCEIYSNTATPVKATGTASIVRCLIYNNTGASTDGISVQGSALIAENVFYANGRNAFTGSPTTVSINNIFEGNVGTGISASVRVNAFNNAFYNNGTTITSGFQGVGDSPIIGTSSFFTNAAGGDFSLNNTASAGALVRAAGFPQSFPLGTTASRPDIGAAQHQETTPVGTAVIVRPANFF